MQQANSLSRQELKMMIGRHVGANQMLESVQLARAAAAGQIHRPHYHFANPTGFINDPNGLCFYKGLWHLFYQYAPECSLGPCWWHAVSTDLIHWLDLPEAISRQPEDEAIASGNVFIEADGRAIAPYPIVDHAGKVRGINLSVSQDDLLLHWQRITERGVIFNKSLEGQRNPYYAFDPFLWKTGGFYYLISAGGGSLPHPVTRITTRKHFLFRSSDLVKWEYLHEFVENDSFAEIGDDGACPYFYPIGDQSLLLHFSHMSGGKYIIGDFDQKRMKFTATSGGSFNSASWTAGGTHAPSAFPDGKGGVIAIYNINWGITDFCKGSNQIMSLPRRFTLPERNDLRVEPAGDYQSLRYGHLHIGQTELPANEEVVLPDVKGKSMEIIAEFAAQKLPMLEIDLFRSPGREEVTRICFYKARGKSNWETWNHLGMFDSLDSIIAIDSSRSSLLPEALPRAPESAALFIAPDEILKLHIFIDQSVLEVFINDKKCISMRVYPTRQDSQGISLRAQGQNGTLLYLDAWQMKDVWEGGIDDEIHY